MTQTHNPVKYPLDAATLRAEIQRLLALADPSHLRFVYFYLRHLDG